jgi:acetyl-CoA carboxylase biotin carboxyl carrier protein
MKIDKSIIKELSDYLDEFNLAEIEITEKDTKIKVSKNNVSISNQPVLTTTSQAIQNENTASVSNTKSGTEVTSPIIGTAYHAPEPGAKKFVEVGKKIKKGETIMIVEAMKTMNHVPSTADGIVKEICVEDGQPVEYGHTIIIVESCLTKFSLQIVGKLQLGLYELVKNGVLQPLLFTLM